MGRVSVSSEEGFPKAGSRGLFWLGQAGFWIETGAHRILIDPYLSDSLAKKYQGRGNDHARMMAPPVEADALERPDLVLVTHGHTDHLDPETLAPLHARFPGVPFVVPAACEALARERIGADATLILAEADEVLSPLPGLSLTVFPAAHEERERDEAGRDKFLGYGISAGGLRIYHSGDCIPFEGLEARVKAFEPQIFLLPVNGRDEARRASGVPGNFHLHEAAALAKGGDVLIPHHFGMFAFNSISPAEIDEAAKASSAPRIIRPHAGRFLAIGGGA